MKVAQSFIVKGLKDLETADEDFTTVANREVLTNSRNIRKTPQPLRKVQLIIDKNLRSLSYVIRRG